MKTTYKYFILLLALVISSSDLFAQNEIQRVRIDFETPLGYVRHLLLGFTPDDAASDGFDYGYDAPNIENHPDDMNWMIDDNRYVIQGVGAFDESKIYPLGIFLTNSGNITISLFALENFITPIDVFVYDSQTDEYTLLGASNYENLLTSGDYLDRFYLTFMDGHADASFLSLSEISLEKIQVRYDKFRNSLLINTHNTIQVESVDLYSMTGQSLYKFTSLNDSELALELPQIGSNLVIVVLKTSQGIHYKRLIVQN